jgi:hypothetical protein
LRAPTPKQQTPRTKFRRRDRLAAGAWFEMPAATKIHEAGSAVNHAERFHIAIIGVMEKW